MKLDICHNILLYVPMGMLLWRYKNVKWEVLFLLFFPAAIEFAQLATCRGIFEISDILNNFIGGLIGLFTVFIIKKLYKKIR